MVKKHAFAGVLCVGALLWGANLHAQKPSKSAQSELGQCYAGLARAWQARDTKGMMQLWTKDYTEVTMKGKVLSRADAEKQLQGFLKVWKYGIVMRYKITGLKEKEGGKVLEATLSQEGEIKTGTKPTDKTANLVAEFRHVWRKTPQGWRLQQQKPIIDLKAMQRDYKAVPLRAK